MEIELFFERKSGIDGVLPWASNTYTTTEDGSLVGLDEYHEGPAFQCAHGGSTSVYRSFRRYDTRMKGNLVFPAYVVDYQWVQPPGYFEELWDGCSGVKLCDNPGTVREMYFLGAEGSYFIKDCRTGQDCSLDHPISTLSKWEYWGITTELYVYGAWIDPVFGRADGLGIVHWAKWENDRLVDYQYYDRLVETQQSYISCWTVPDLGCQPHY
ncbi:MAG: hypothetical protein IT186_22835 [Acidobacteria bacterium]|nr:hypothetical protein [Acidobacteriota bacterium]